MKDWMKAALALAVGLAFSAWAGWFNPWNWRSWVLLIVVATISSLLTWVFKQYDGSNVKW
jgi:hypothetical protein